MPAWYRNPVSMSALAVFLAQSCPSAFGPNRPRPCEHIWSMCQGGICKA